MNEYLEIREIKENEIKEAISFHNEKYGDNRLIDYWKWEYRGIYPDKSVFYIIYDDNRIVGTQGMIPICLNINGNVLLTGKSENSLLDEKYRGKGLFEKLYEYTINQSKMNGMKYIWGLTQASYVWKNKLKFQVSENVLSMYLAPNNISDTYNHFSAKLKNKKYIYKFVAYIFITIGYLNTKINYELKINKSIPKSEYVIQDSQNNYKDIEELYVQLRKKNNILVHINLDVAYTNWRFTNNPKNKYKSYYVYNNGILKGYCHYCITSNQSVEISDLTFIDDEAGSILIKYLINKLKDEKIPYYYYLGNNNNLMNIEIYKLLRKYGFIKINNPMSFVIKNISNNSNDIVDISKWYINGLWLEGL